MPTPIENLLWEQHEKAQAERGEASFSAARGWGEPDLKTAELEIELASISVTHGSHPKVIEVTIGHLQKAIEALRPVRPNDDISDSRRD
jgi:hypothetical protein